MWEGNGCLANLAADLLRDILQIAHHVPQAKNVRRVAGSTTEPEKYPLGGQLFQAVGIRQPEFHSGRIHHDRTGEDNWRSGFRSGDDIADHQAIRVSVGSRYPRVTQCEIDDHIAVAD